MRVFTPRASDSRGDTVKPAHAISRTAAALLGRMLNDYERGAKFERADAKDVLLRVDERSFPDAFSPDGHEALQLLLVDVSQLERAGALRVARKRLPGGGEQIDLRLGPNEVQTAYNVAGAHGYTPLRERLNILGAETERMIAEAVNGATHPQWWIDYLRGIHEGVQRADIHKLMLASRERIKDEWSEVRDTLIAANRLAGGVDAWGRHESERLFGDSKRLNAIKARVAAILRKADPRWEGAEPDMVTPDDVLENYGIRRRPVTITCAGSVGIALDVGRERVYQLADFSPVATLPSAWGPALADGVLAGDVRLVTTIENEYPFLSYVEEAGGAAGLAARGEFVLFTSGFVAPHLMDLLRGIAEHGRGRIQFQHWGDADPHGLSIWWQLRTSIHQPVALYRTTADWVERAAERDGKPLGPFDARLLQIHIDRCGDLARAENSAEDLNQAVQLAQTILRLGVKIEQERQ